MLSQIPSRWVVTETDLSTAPDVFPYFPGVGFPQKYPEWSTLRREAQSGRAVKNARWSVPRWNFSLSYEVLRGRVSLPEISRLWAFLNSAKGQYAGWFFHDPYDDTATNASLGVGDGATTSFQATRTLGASMGYAFDDAVYAFWQTPTVYIDGVSTTAFTVNAWGVITFSSAPASGAVLTWTGKFLFPCEFKNDTANTKQIFASLFSADGIEFRTIKP